MPPAKIFDAYPTWQGKILRLLEWAKHHGVIGIEVKNMIPGISYSTATNELGKLVREGLAVRPGDQRRTPSGEGAKIVWLPEYGPAPRKPTGFQF